MKIQLPAARCRSRGRDGARRHPIDGIGCGLGRVDAVRIGPSARTVGSDGEIPALGRWCRSSSSSAHPRSAEATGREAPPTPSKGGGPPRSRRQTQPRTPRARFRGSPPTWPLRERSSNIAFEHRPGHSRVPGPVIVETHRSGEPEPARRRCRCRARCLRELISASLRVDAILGEVQRRPAAQPWQFPPRAEVGQCRNTRRAISVRTTGWTRPRWSTVRRNTRSRLPRSSSRSEATLAQVKQLDDECVRPTFIYLGIFSSVVRNLVLPVAYWPSPAQRAAGQNWLRCDVGVRATVLCCRPRALLAPQTGSLRGEEGLGPSCPHFLMCLDQFQIPPATNP